MARTRRRVDQAWIELVADDPEAVSALAVARAHLPAGRALRGLRRLRVFEIAGALPDRDAVADLLHRSTRFYNPHKERCTVREDADDAAPVAPGERVVLVWETGGERRPAAERWWRHETRRAVEVREAVAWVLAFEPGADADGAADDLAAARDRRHGLLCNPHAQEYRHVSAATPFPWMAAAPARPRRTSSR